MNDYYLYAKKQLETANYLPIQKYISQRFSKSLRLLLKKITNASLKSAERIIVKK